jgi:hypothetical protein
LRINDLKWHHWRRSEQEWMSMVKRKNKSKPSPATSAARAHDLGSVGLAWCAAALVLVSGCTVIPRLDARFDTDPLGVPPSTPTPTPPNDSMNWRTGFVASSVVADPAGGRLVRAAALPAFTSSPDNRQVFLIAVTEPFTTSPPANIRGRVRLRLNSLGTVGLGLRLLQAEQSLDFIGGFELTNFLPPSGGGVNLLQGFRGDRLSDPFAFPSSGSISSYTPGSVIDINWTLDQPSRTFSASVLGGPSQSTSFPAMFGGNATTPIQRLQVYMWMQRPNTDTVLFIDNLIAEEYR